MRAVKGGLVVGPIGFCLFLGAYLSSCSLFSFTEEEASCSKASFPPLALAESLYAEARITCITQTHRQQCEPKELHSVCMYSFSTLGGFYERCEPTDAYRRAMSLVDPQTLNAEAHAAWNSATKHQFGSIQGYPHPIFCSKFISGFPSDDTEEIRKCIDRQLQQTEVLP